MKKGLIIIFVIGLIALGSGWALTYSTLREVKSELEVQYKTLQERDLELQELQEDLRNLERDFATKKVEWENLERTLQENIETLEREVTSLQDSIDLYKDTFGEVYSGVSPPYSVYASLLKARKVSLINNEEATNPTWEELRSFLRRDETDQYDYIPGAQVCGNFAEILHNNAEEAGIRSAWVALGLEGYSEGHALNAFKTTDRGLVYIDSTGLEPYKAGPRICDKIWTIKLGKEPIIKSVFPQSGWQTRWRLPTAGKVTSIEIYW